MHPVIQPVVRLVVQLVVRLVVQPVVRLVVQLVVRLVVQLVASCKHHIITLSRVGRAGGQILYPLNLWL